MKWLLRWWRVLVAIALVLGVLYIRHQLQENKDLIRANRELTRAVDNLNARQARVELALVANDKDDTEERQQAAKGVARNETARRSDPHVIAIDRPWPAAMRQRVFDNPDPASGSTAPAEPAGAGER